MGARKQVGFSNRSAQPDRPSVTDLCNMATPIVWHRSNTPLEEQWDDRRAKRSKTARFTCTEGPAHWTNFSYPVEGTERAIPRRRLFPDTSRERMTTTTEALSSRSWLQIDTEAEIGSLTASMREQLAGPLKRRGFVVGMSGGVDSSVAAGLAVAAVGPKKVFGIFMPERDSDPRSLELAREWADKLGIEYAVEDIAPALAALGCYTRRDEAIARVVPGYGPGWKSKIVLPGDRLNSDRLNTFSIVVESPEGEQSTHRLPPAEYRVIVAATNFKQRVRKMLEYYHADRLHFAVIGTPNRLEYDQGFFVKGGDGLADSKPMAHLYKTQVYALASALGVPRGVTDRPSTTDTYSLPQSQEEFYFVLPARTMDLVLYAHNHAMAAAEAATALGLTAEQVERAYREIEQKRSTTRYLHLGPILAEPVSELHLHDDEAAR